MKRLPEMVMRCQTFNAPFSGRSNRQFTGGYDFWGVCTCRAGPMCPAGYAFFGGARGPRPTGRYVEPPVGDDVPSARQRRAGRRIPTPVCALARNDRSKTAGRCGHRPLRNDRKRGGQSCPPLQKDCQRTPLRMSSATARRVTQQSMACFSI